MIYPYAVAGFLVAIFPLVATPGASLTLLIRHVTEAGRRRALPVILGTATGLYVHAALAVAGLSALVMQSSRAFTAVKLAGAVYLIGLGVWTWRSATWRGTTVADSRPGPRNRSNSAYVQALLANVLNPKAASIYLTLTPQFVLSRKDFAAQLLTLTTAHAVLMAFWLLGWALLVRRAARTLQKPRFKHALARASSAVLIALGVRSVVTWGMPS